MHTQTGIRLLVLLSLGGMTSLSVAECDCTTFPFEPEPPCQNQCFAKLLNESSAGSLETVFGFSTELVNKIGRIRAQAGGKTPWESYERSLTVQEFRALRQGLGTLNTDKVASLNAQSSALPDTVLGRYEPEDVNGDMAAQASMDNEDSEEETEPAEENNEPESGREPEERP